MADLIADFFAATTSPTTAQVSWLVRQGVPNLTLARDGDGRGWILGAADILVTKARRFSFANARNDDGTKPSAALIFLARGEDGELIDMVAWRPREDDVSSYLGRAGILGWHDLFAGRLEPAFAIHEGVIGWLKAGRTGGVIVHPSLARRALEGVSIIACDVDHGQRLREALRPPAIVIKVPRDGEAMVAAQRCLEALSAAPAGSGKAGRA